MFVVKKMPKKRIWIALLLAVFMVALAFLVANGNSMTATAKNGHTYSLEGESETQRMGFLQQFGWSVLKCVQTESVVIPMEFNQTYEEYNELQKENGLDLSKYKGKKCRLYRYELEENGMWANVLVFDNVVIGGDITDARSSKILHGFEVMEKSG